MYYYRLRIRNAADSADALTVTSLTSGSNPYISQPPSGDGQGFDPRTGETEIGAYTVLIADNGSAAAAITGFLADGSGRYDKLGRRAYMESGTDGATFPTLLVAGYVTAISFPSAAEAQVTIGEAQRAEDSKRAFEQSTSAFPPTTMLAGGPIRTAIPHLASKVPDLGMWTVRVNLTPSSAAFVPLQFRSGMLFAKEEDPEATHVTDGALPWYAWNRINTLTAGESAGNPVLDGMVIRWQLRNVYVELYTTSGTLVGTFPVYRQPAFGPSQYNYALTTLLPPGTPVRTIDDAFTLWADFTGIAAPSVGQEYKLLLYSRTVSESNPIHIFMHPVDIITGLITDAGGSFDATTAASVKADIGANVRMFLRITQSATTREFVDKLLGLYGMGRRINSANAWEFVSPRAKGAAPGTTLAYADLREMPGEVWNLSESTIVNTLTISQQRFAVWAPGHGTPPADYLVATEQTRTADYMFSDGSLASASQGVRELKHEIPGTIVTLDGGELDLEQFTYATAATTFDRWGHGAPSTTLFCRDTVTAKAGDEVVLNMGFLPNGNVRGGNRIVQVLRRTNSPGGPELHVEDAGLSSQPSVSPTFTIIASPGAPLSVAQVAVTNAAALVAAGVQSVLFEWQVSVGAPAVAGQDLGSVEPASPVALTTPAVAAGSRVWARAQSIQPGRRPSAWTAWADVTLASVGAPGALTATAVAADGSLEDLSWTAGANSSGYPIEVLVKVSGGTVNQRVVQLLPGSLRARLEGLTPGTAYTATVRYLDPTSGIPVATSTVTFTTSVTTIALVAPASPTGFSGNRDAVTGALSRDAVYGIAVVAASFPGAIEVQEAVETAVGSGAYGAFATVGQPIPNVLGDWTIWQNVAPNDGKRRQLKARHVRTGATSSAYTSVVTVTPWTPIAIPIYPTDIIVQVVVSAPASDTLAQTRVTCVVNAIDPQGGATLVTLNSLTSNASVIAGAAVGTPAASGSSWTFARPGILKGSAAAEFVADSNPAASRQSQRAFLDIPEQGQQASPVMTLTVKENGSVEIMLDGNNDTASFSYAESTAAMPSDAAATAGTVVNGRVATITSVAVLAMGQRFFFKAVPWNAAGGTGTAGQIVSGSIDRQNKSTAGKRIYYPGSFTHPQDDTSVLLRSVNSISTSAVSTTTFVGYIPFLLPDGVTITTFETITQRAQAAGVATVQFFRSSRGSAVTTLLATHTNSTTGSSQLITTAGLSEVVANDSYDYAAVVTLTCGAAGVGEPSTFWGAGFIYTSSDFTKSV